MIAVASVADEKLYDLLPNGLHDADLRSFTMNYAEHELTLAVAAWVSTGEPRELYRSARVTFGGVTFICIEPPRDRAELSIKQSIRIDAEFWICNMSWLPTSASLTQSTMCS